MKKECSFGLDWRILLFREDISSIINYDDKSYCDEQKIKVPSGKYARQIGTCRYT
ncbi:hypothetical protein [Barnesiella intestinihominis]|uniref:hypothetical protein n=1 Tax=Barnesiella intestinihominis TaxID=487174 RepID=UPI003AF0BC3E